MNLTLPVPTVTLGPEWATELNQALTDVDAHDHSSGKGTKIKPNGIDINSDLDYQNYRAIGLKASKYGNQVATLTGATNSNSVYTVSDNLYFTNGAGVAVQITSGGSVVSVPGATTTLQFNNFSSDVTIAPADPYVYLAMDMSAIRTVTLPLASSVASGRIYVIKDSTGQSETNTLTIAASGADTVDGAASQTINSNYATTFVIGNGVNGWLIV